MKKHVMTRSAIDKVHREMEELIKKRKEIAEEIKKARGFGDLSENAEYHAARDAQSQNETEILKLREILENAEIVDEADAGSTMIAMNSEVTFEYIEEKETETVKIVSSVEADPLEGLMSTESPIGNAIMGKQEGDEAEIQTPNGIIHVRILKVKN